MRKFFLSVLFAALTMSLSAQGEVTRYFFSPLGNGDQDGTSWENAAAAEDLGATLASAEPGTEFYLMEGNFDMSNATICNNSAIYRNHKQGIFRFPRCKL